jgi:hypothetical protein
MSPARACNRWIAFGDVRRARGAAAGLPGRDRLRGRVGVLLDTIVVRSLLVPACGYDIGQGVWRPSRLAAARSPTAIQCKSWCAYLSRRGSMTSSMAFPSRLRSTR